MPKEKIPITRIKQTDKLLKKISFVLAVKALLSNPKSMEKPKKVDIIKIIIDVAPEKLIKLKM